MPPVPQDLAHECAHSVSGAQPPGKCRINKIHLVGEVGVPTPLGRATWGNERCFPLRRVSRPRSQSGAESPDAAGAQLTRMKTGDERNPKTKALGKEPQRQPRCKCRRFYFKSSKAQLDHESLSSSLYPLVLISAAAPVRWRA